MGVFEVILFLAILNGTGPLVAVLLHEFEASFDKRNACRREALYRTLSDERLYRHRP